MGQEKLGRGTKQHHKKATPHPSPCQIEQATGGMEFLHMYDTRGTYQSAAGILVLTLTSYFFVFLLDVLVRYLPVWGSPKYEICFFVVPSGSG